MRRQHDPMNPPAEEKKEKRRSPSGERAHHSHANDCSPTSPLARPPRFPPLARISSPGRRSQRLDPRRTGFLFLVKGSRAPHRLRLVVSALLSLIRPTEPTTLACEKPQHSPPSREVSFLLRCPNMLPPRRAAVATQAPSNVTVRVRAGGGILRVGRQGGTNVHPSLGLYTLASRVGQVRVSWVPPGMFPHAPERAIPRRMDWPARISPSLLFTELTLAKGAEPTVFFIFFSHRNPGKWAHYNEGSGCPKRSNVFGPPTLSLAPARTTLPAVW